MWKQSVEVKCKTMLQNARPYRPEHHQRNVCLVAGIYSVQGPFAEVIHKAEARQSDLSSVPSIRVQRKE